MKVDSQTNGLFIGGYFDIAGGISANNVVKYSIPNPDQDNIITNFIDMIICPNPISDYAIIDFKSNITIPKHLNNIDIFLTSINGITIKLKNQVSINTTSYSNFRIRFSTKSDHLQNGLYILSIYFYDSLLINSKIEIVK